MATVKFEGCFVLAPGSLHECACVVSRWPGQSVVLNRCQQETVLDANGKMTPACIWHLERFEAVSTVMVYKEGRMFTIPKKDWTSAFSDQEWLMEAGMEAGIGDDEDGISVRLADEPQEDEFGEAVLRLVGGDEFDEE